MAARMRGLPHPPPVGADCCPLHPTVSHRAPCPFDWENGGKEHRGVTGSVLCQGKRLFC